MEVLLGEILIVALLFSLGMLSLWKYKKTKDKKYFYAGIFFSVLSIVGILILLYYYFIYEPSQQIMCYKISQIAAPASAGFVLAEPLRKKLAKKYKNILPKEVYDKISKKD